MNYRNLSFCLASLVALPLVADSSRAELSQADPLTSSKMTLAEGEVFRSLRTLRDPEAAGPEVVGLDIQSQGSGVLECLMAMIEERQIPDPDDLEGTAQILSEVQLEAILVALEAFGRDSSFATWQVYFEEPLNHASTNAAIYSLGAFGNAKDLERLMELPVVEGEKELHSRVKQSLRAATAAILGRDPRAFSRLGSTWSRLPNSWQIEIVKAVGETGDSGGLELLTDMYRRSPGHQRLIACQLPLTGPSNSATENRELAQELLEGLRSESKEDVQAAALGLAVLEDFSVLPDLIELLDDARPGVKVSAHHALTKLTNKTLTPSSELWKRWYKRELDWFANERNALVGRLRNRDHNVVVAALRELGRHRLNRHELALDVAPSMKEFSEAVRIMTITALSELGSRWGAESLVEALDDNEEAVRVAAYSALCVVTGTDCGQEVEGWLEADLPTRP